MTAKEKAKQILKLFINPTRVMVKGKFEKNLIDAKLCALFCVNEIILSNPHSNPFNTDVYSTMDYWQEVKNELKKL